MGVKFGVDAKFTPIGAICCPCRAQNLKIGLWVT